VRRGEVWWASLPSPVGRRPVVLLSRDEAYNVRASVTVAEVTTKARGIPVEVALGPEDGLPRACVVNLDTIVTIRKEILVERIAALSKANMELIDKAAKFALALS
jgi:mRNA interferase MazF